MNPGDVLEGRGRLLQHGRLVVEVDYHLTIPRDLYFVINPTGSLHLDYEDYLAGFILVRPDEAEKILLTDYVLELAGKFFCERLASRTGVRSAPPPNH